MKINGIGIKLNPGKHREQKTSCATSPITSHGIGACDVLNYMNMTSLSFRGDKISGGDLPLYGKISPKKATFEDTIDRNYFKLPVIKTKKGNMIQALPDKTQLACAKSIYDGNNTICIAPTGTGKTAIANYAITKNMSENKKTIYTTPLKALSNDKYREFSKLYGSENVGLLTGDIKLNGEAPIVIMTTEIYRNMALDAYSKGDYKKFNNVKSVIFDEAHYISESERGKTWEESVMLTPPDVQIVPLSATIGNGEEFTEWIKSVTSLPATLVEAAPRDRHVPLVYYNYVEKSKNHFEELIRGDVNIISIKDNFENDNLSQRQIRAIDMLVQKRTNHDDDYHATYEEQKMVIDELLDMVNHQAVSHQKFSGLLQKKFRLTPLQSQELAQLLLDSDTRSIRDFCGIKRSKSEKNNYRNLIGALKKEDKLPALVFIFSRRGCNQATEILANSGLNLTTKEEKEEIKKIIDEYKANGVYLGKEFNENELIQGVASHHAGLLPAYKKLVEELFSKKLVKTVFATSTLSAGINMPAKTVVVTSIDKPTKNKEGFIEYVPLTSNEFHQMSGRAGRRGIDTIGNVVLYDIGKRDVEIAKDLILKSPDNAESAFSPSYSFLPAYYKKVENDDLLEYFEQNTLKVFQSENPEKEARRLKYEFIKYRDVLLEKGFLTETQYGFKPTQKGQMLAKAHGYNELTLIDSIYSKNLKKLNAPELAAFAASMGAEKESENKEIEDMMFLNYLKRTTSDENRQSALIDVLDAALEYDDETESLEQLMRTKVRTTEATGVFEAALTYAWAKSNLEDDEKSIQNFKTLQREIIGKKNAKNGISPSVERGFEDGAVYAKIAKSVDVLKQIINICEFAIESGDFEDTSYYKDLIDTSYDAIDLIARPPIYDINAVGANEN